MAATTSINLGILSTPNLSQTERDTLLGALEAALAGAKVQVSISYHKVTKSKARIAGDDYVPMGPAPLLIGEVKKVAVGKNGPYILLDATITRRPLDGGEPSTTKLGWTSIKGEGIKELRGTRNRTDEVKAAEAKKQARADAEDTIAYNVQVLHAAATNKAKAEADTADTPANDIPL